MKYRDFKIEFRQAQANTEFVELVFNSNWKYEKYSTVDFKYYIIPAIHLMRRTDNITLQLSNSEDSAIIVYKTKKPTRSIQIIHRDNTVSKLSGIPINQLFSILRRICINKESYIDITNNNHNIYNRRPK